MLSLTNEQCCRNHTAALERCHAVPSDIFDRPIHATGPLYSPDIRTFDLALVLLSYRPVELPRFCRSAVLLSSSTTAQCRHPDHDGVFEAHRLHGCSLVDRWSYTIPGRTAGKSILYLSASPDCRMCLLTAPRLFIRLEDISTLGSAERCLDR